MSAFVAQLSDDLYKLALLAIPIIGGYLINMLKKHFSANTLAVGVEIARIAVQATEQMAKNGNLNGAQKFSIAQSQARTLAERFGLRLSDAEWQSLIERAVSEVTVVVGSLSAMPDTPPPGQPVAGTHTVWIGPKAAH